MIECVKFKEINKNSLYGYADFWVEKMGLEIYGCAVFQIDGRKWISMPSREYKDADGNSKFIPILRFRQKAHMDAFSKQGFFAIKQYMKRQKENPPVYDDKIHPEELCLF